MGLLSTGFGVYVKGYKESWRCHPLVGISYLFNLITAALITWPFVDFLSTILADGRAGEYLLKQYELTLLIQLFYQHTVHLPAFSIVSGYFVLYLLGATLMTGGILHIFTRYHSFDAINFFLGGIFFFLRFIRLYLLLFIFLFFLFMLNIIIVIAMMIIFGSWILPVIIILTVIQFAILLMWFDYTRIMMVLHDRQKIRDALREAVRFVYKRFCFVSALYLLYWLPVFFLFVLHLILPDLSQMGVCIAFMYSQLIIVIRSYLRLSMLAGQTVYVISSESSDGLSQG
jgi:hypothetical protein